MGIMDISIRLKQIRKERNLSQKKVAEAIGLAQQNYARYERGERIPRIEQLIALANHFGVSLDYLTARTDDPHGGYSPSADTDTPE